MRCADIENFSEEQAATLAFRALEAQLAQVTRAVRCVLAGKPEVERFVVSGSGAILAHNAAKQWGKPVTSLAESLGPARSEAACAYAVANLAQEERDER